MKLSRNTDAKTQIQNLVAHSRVALSHSEIQKQLDGLCDRVTVYRVLERLIETGQIHKIVNMDGVLRFAGCHNCADGHHHNHVHFSCEKCKMVTCLEGVEPSYTLPKNYVVRESNFIMSGYCPECS